jgi:hypothetical protein
VETVFAGTGNRTFTVLVICRVFYEVKLRQERLQREWLLPQRELRVQ